MMTKIPILPLPDFSQQFIIECDASSKGIGAVLMQGQRPICFLSKPLSPRSQSLSAYEGELLAIIQAVTTWRSYLEVSPFVIKTDQQSIKHLLEQRLHTMIQQKGVVKLLGLDYEIQYKRGTENRVQMHYLERMRSKASLWP